MGALAWRPPEPSTVLGRACVQPLLTSLVPEMETVPVSPSFSCPGRTSQKSSQERPEAPAWARAVPPGPSVPDPPASVNTGPFP